MYRKMLGFSLVGGLLILGALAPAQAQTKKVSKVCFSYQDLETQFWVAGHSTIVNSLKAKGITVIERNANEDPTKQLQQINDCLTQKVDAIITIPQDGASIIPVIKAANAAKVPIALFNREAAASNTAPNIRVVADNEAIAAATVEYMAAQAKKLGRKMNPLIMVGDLGDPNAVARKKGFDKVIAKYPNLFNKPIEVATKWDAQVALAGLQNAMQANPDVDFLFTSSDFMFPQIRSVLLQAGKWKKIGDPKHVVLGGLDGDAGACQLIKDNYLDATGVQNLYFEADAAIEALLKAASAGKWNANELIKDPGFALTKENFATKSKETWGCNVKK